MSFRLIQVGDPSRCGAQCPAAIAAEGEITNSTPAAFINFVQRSAAASDLRSVVFLDSPGGKVVSSMALGQVFRKLGVATIVARPGSGGSQFMAGQCFSACVYALMGGRRRIIPPQSQVGIHRMFSYESRPDPAGGMLRNIQHDDGGMREVLARYSSMMGVSRNLVDTAESTSSQSIRVLSQGEIARWRLGASRLTLDDAPKVRRRR